MTQQSTAYLEISELAITHFSTGEAVNSYKYRLGSGLLADIYLIKSQLTPK